jgi:hypothetical protein
MQVGVGVFRKSKLHFENLKEARGDVSICPPGESGGLRAGKMYYGNKNKALMKIEKVGRITTKKRVKHGLIPDYFLTMLKFAQPMNNEKGNQL